MRDSQHTPTTIWSLKERAKELDCLYQLEEILDRFDEPLGEVMRDAVAAVATGLQYPQISCAEIVVEETHYRECAEPPTSWVMREPIKVQERQVGHVSAYYTEPRPEADEGPFLKEERRLLRSIAAMIGRHLFFRRVAEAPGAPVPAPPAPDDRWRGPIDLIRRSDLNLYKRISRKLLNHLCWIGVNEAQELLGAGGDESLQMGEINEPGKRQPDLQVLLSGRPFELAARHLSYEELLSLVQRWVREDRASFLLKTLQDNRSSLPDIADAIRRYRQIAEDESALPPSSVNGLRVSLIRRMLTDQLDLIRVAKDVFDLEDFERLIDRTVLPGDGGHGRLGGKAVGMLLAANILEKRRSPDKPIGTFKTPRTWFVSSDALRAFMWYNNLEDVSEQKYKPIEQIRHDYPQTVQLFKSSTFPRSLVKALAVALDGLGNTPLIVRSSGLLEDRLGTAFSGKYKSLFLPNVGSRQRRLARLLDAVAEVYASLFSPDPIEYRRERGLIDFNEEMGLLIQSVVGQRVGRYFFPAFGGVAFSNNEFRWSPRINRKDGLVRLVPGLGTRAVDRVADDYPVLAVPGQPNLRVNTSVEEVIRYSPSKIDVLNLEADRFETLEVSDLLRICEGDYPALESVFSVHQEGLLREARPLLIDPENDELIANFEGLLSRTAFLNEIRNMMQILEEELGTPVDIEFAHDGVDFYLLQCRPQSYSEDAAPAPIPKDLPPEDVLFTANRYVSNGWVPDITHIVYVDADRYGMLSTHQELLDVGRAVRGLNKLLPKRQFILMGPGRWGSRGDVKLGVKVTYSDISNTAMLIEIARRRGNYVPDLSFGTHFFQDLVESAIRYLPLYPDDDGVIFNHRFLLDAENLLEKLAPSYAHLREVVRVVDVPAETRGRVLKVMMNADLDEAVALLAPPGDYDVAQDVRRQPVQRVEQSNRYWRWRFQMAERIARDLDPERFGVEAIYVFGSTKNATAGPASDIDLLVHFTGTADQRRSLLTWLDGWSSCLEEINYLRTGYRVGKMVDVHIVTDEDIARKTSYAVKIGAVTDAARELPLGTGPKNGL